MNSLLLATQWSIGISIWFWALCLVGLLWLRRHFDINKAHREAALSPADADESGSGDKPPVVWPKLSVLVAAKDEEANIGRCADSLLKQDYPDFEFIIINDRSGDRTAEIIDGFAARDRRLRAVHVKELRAGWFGKNNAMREGVERASGDYLCFSDADCAFDSPVMLRAAMRFAQRNDIDFLSVLPRIEANSFWERVVQPPAGGIMVFWFPPSRVNNPRTKVAYANGAFMLMTRKAYDAMGGHEFAKATLNEDMHMARRAKDIGLRLHVVRGGEMYRVRMYTGFQQIWRGWSRIFYGCFGTFPRLAASAIFLSLFSVGPYASLLLSPLAGSAGLWIAAAAAWAICAQQSVLRRFYVLSGVGPNWAMTYPLGAALCVGMTLNAMTRLFGSTTTWRGTAYQGGAKTTAR